MPVYVVSVVCIMEFMWSQLNLATVLRLQYLLTTFPPTRHLKTTGCLRVFMMFYHSRAAPGLRYGCHKPLSFLGNLKPLESYHP